MERMWRKVNQGLTNTSTLLKQSRNHNNNNNHSNRNSNGNYDYGDEMDLQQAATLHVEDDGPVYANVQQHNPNWGYIDTSKCRKRRRKLKTRRNSSKEKHSKGKKVDKPKETSLRERAVAKLKILNFNINWDVHMKPCGSRVNTNILTRRLCRNRSCDDNELYRSNSFKFERFRRDDGDGAAVGVNTLPKQVNICDDYSLPVDFVKKRPSSLEQCRDVKFADDFPSPNIINDQIIPIQENRPLSTASASIVPKLLRNYCEPKDTKKFKHRKHSNKSIRYSSNSSLPNSTEDECPAESKYDSSESVADSYLNNEPEYANQEKLAPQPINTSNTNVDANSNTDTINPSPYYYSDLLGAVSVVTAQAPTTSQRSLKAASTLYSNTSTAPKKFQSFLDDPPSPDVTSPPAQYKRRNQNQPKRHSISEREANRFDTFSSTTSDDSNCSECRKRRELNHLPPSRDESFGASVDFEREEEVPSPAPNEFPPCNCFQPDTLTEDELSSMAPHRLLGNASCICSGEPNNDDTASQYQAKSIFYVHQLGEDQCADCTVNKTADESFTFDRDSMSSQGKRRIQLYETAFDSMVQPCTEKDSRDIEERIRNIMLRDPQYRRPNEQRSNEINFNCDYQNNRPTNGNRNKPLTPYNSSSSKNLSAAASSTSVRYANTQTPPSTAPMPIKFPEQHEQMHFRESIQSVPNLPQSNATPPHEPAERSAKHGKKSSSSRKKCSHGAERVKQVRKSKRKQRSQSTSGAQKYSSTESLSTSDGSNESVHSSASDGNRSSISSGSRNSASLSSHSSDSGARVRYPLRAPVIVHANMNILSPISDKSIQESSEMFGASSRKNLQLFEPNAASGGTAKEFTKQTSVDMMLLENQKQNKRRYLQNRASLILKDEIQGSDSGISLQSRDDTKIKNLCLPNVNGGGPQQAIPTTTANQSQASSQGFTNSGLSLPEDFANLPFDMPKLRRNLLSEQQKQSSQGSATSVDLGELPFDMPKLNRRIRAQTTNDGAPNTLDIMSHASSSLSMRDENRFGSSRKNLSLQFNKTAALKHDALPIERGLHLNLFSAKNKMDVDTALSLDRQGWYHGHLTRIEAESTLRPLVEGSFLVRNCESARNDYSLSLKSAKGFMHMRIQRNDTGKFILGEFSQPFDSVPDIIKHFCLNRLPVRGAEHMCLIEPVIVQLL